MGKALATVSSCRVSEPEHLIEAICGAEIHAQQLTPSHRAGGELNRIPLPGGCVDLAQLQPAMFLNGYMPAGYRTLVYVLKCPQPGHVFSLDAEHTAGYMGCFAPGGALDSFKPAGFASITLTIPEDQFRDALGRHGGKISEKTLSRGAAIKVDPARQQALHKAASGIRKMLNGPGDLLASGSVRQNLERTLRAAFFDAITDSGSRSVRGRLQRYKRFRMVRDYVAFHAGEPIYVDDLAGAVQLTRRGLEAVFHDILGISPVAYLRIRRLHGARQALRESKCGLGAVKQAALDWGFWHMGNFAHEYHALFGERPFETLLPRRL